MKICVIGGGNIGTAIAAIMSHNGNDVFIKSSNPLDWSKKIEYVDSLKNATFKATIKAVTDNPEAVKGMDLVFITVPSFLLKKVIDDISPYLSKHTAIGVVPGTGGVEFITKGLIDSGYTVFGFDRVPCISRLNSYGKSVVAMKKDSVRLAAFPALRTDELSILMQKLFDIECYPLKNYLTVTLTPSNPILHTARLYALYQQASPNFNWDRNILFYEDWDMLSSKIMISCDEELQKICKAMPELQLDEVIPLVIHYESPDAEVMTKKISGIKAFKGITSPMIEKEGRYVMDYESRYFTEDFPYGLCIIKSFANILSVPVPTIDLILQWFEKISGKEYYTKDGFNGKDLVDLAVPQNFGLFSKGQIIDFYNNN